MKDYVIYRIYTNDLIVVRLSKNWVTIIKKNRFRHFFLVGEL